ncbi:Protein trichome birefringence [Rhynchospora pubera]|uniref:Protein trichome birefringence n=1 Tax=Rhynchospora pubera TaxID=906938 RepID=A0AAV8D3V0_9POAL|nr:Protein trichome birefringence [Rhynchospora pubera]
MTMKAAVQRNQRLHLNNVNVNPRTRKVVTYTLCALIPLALLHYYLLVPYQSSSQSQAQIHTALPPSSPLLLNEARHCNCNHSSGQWIPDDRGPLYNGTSCHTIKDNQNCMAHGRPDTAYLYWRWRPTGCSLPRFDPLSFLQIISNRHVAFIGDSMARNQAESLMCLLATGSPSPPELVYRDSAENRYRRWVFGSHNATVSIYWSPFLVKRIEKSEKAGIRHNRVFLDALDERWAKDLEAMDVILFSLGHWFLIPGIYYEKGQIIGCHVCPEFKHTEIGFFDVFRKAVRTTLEEVRRRHVEEGRRQRLVAVTTFTQAHFEGDWDKAGSCARTEPYKEGEAQMEYTTARMRTTLLHELERIRMAAVNGLHFQAVDVTRLAMLRPDGHPGPYMNPDPFGSGKARDRERVQNDCVHWCMPGPVDTFNEIFWQLLAENPFHKFT